MVHPQRIDIDPNYPRRRNSPTDGVWEMLASRPAARIDAYRKYVAREDSRELGQLFSRKRWPVFLGSEKFMARVRGRFFSKKTDSEVPQRKELAPALDRLVGVVSLSSIAYGQSHATNDHP